MASRFMEHHYQQWEELQSMSPTFRQSWKDYLLSIELDKDRVTNIIRDLSECTCCEAHQQNRPDYLCKPVNEPPEEKENFFKTPIRLFRDTKNILEISNKFLSSSLMNFWESFLIK